MKIDRWGARANYGTRTVEFASPKFDWHAEQKVLQIMQRRAPDFSNTNGHHDYVVSMTIEDLSRIIEVIAKAALADPSVFESDLRKLLPHFIRLEAVGAGVARV